MKRLLLAPLLALGFLSPFAANAGASYESGVNSADSKWMRGSLNSNKNPKIKLTSSTKKHQSFLISLGHSNNERLTKLKYAMKIVGARMKAGISYNDLNTTFLPLIDSLAVTEDDYPDDLIVEKAKISMQIFNILKSYWGQRISSTESDGNFVWSADKSLVPYINSFNKVYLSINPEGEKLTIPKLKKQYGSQTMDIVDAKTKETVIYQYLSNYLSE